MNLGPRGLFKMGIFCVCLVWDFGVSGLPWPCLYACGFYGVAVCVFMYVNDSELLC